MKIPTFWARAESNAQAPRGGRLALLAWGWSSSSLSDARAVAQERLQRLVARVSQGEALPKGYAYGTWQIHDRRLRTG